MKNDIHKYETNVDVDEIWGAIEPEVDAINKRRRKRRTLLIWLSAGASALGLGLLLLAYFSDVPTSDNNENNTSQVKSEIAENSSKTLTNTIANIPTEEYTAEENYSTETAQNIDVQNVKSNLTEKSSSQKSSRIVATGKKANALKNHKLIVNENAIHNIEKHSPKNHVLSTVTENEKVEKASKTSFIPTQLLNTSNLSFLEVVKLPIDMEFDFIPKSLNESSSKKLSFVFDIGLNYGAGLLQRKLTEKTANTATELLQLRRTSERMLEQQHYGFAAKLTHEAGLSLTSGIRQAVITELYTNNNIAIETDSIWGVKKRVIQLSGDTVDIEGAVFVTRTYEYEKQVYNRYKMIDIPFILGYERAVNNWSIGVQGGAILNLSLATSGQVRSTETSDLDVKANQADIYKSKVGLSVYGGLRFAHHFDNGLLLCLSPHLQIYTQDFTVTNYALQQKYAVYGLEVGASYQFGN